MKKITTFTLIVGITLGIVGCKKDYTCSCSGAVKDDSGNTVAELSDEYPISNSKESDAEDDCNTYEQSFKQDAKEAAQALNFSSTLYTGTGNCDLIEK